MNAGGGAREASPLQRPTRVDLAKRDTAARRSTASIARRTEDETAVGGRRHRFSARLELEDLREVVVEREAPARDDRPVIGHEQPARFRAVYLDAVDQRAVLLEPCDLSPR